MTDAREIFEYIFENSLEAFFVVLVLVLAVGFLVRILYDN